MRAMNGGLLVISLVIYSPLYYAVISSV